MIRINLTLKKGLIEKLFSHWYPGFKTLNSYDEKKISYNNKQNNKISFCLINVIWSFFKPTTKLLSYGFFLFLFIKKKRIILKILQF